MLEDNSAVAKSLQWVKHPVLDDGFVCLVDVMGSDSSVVQAARVSYGKDSRDDRERFEATARKMFPDGGTSSYADSVDGRLVYDWGPEQRQAVHQKLAKDERGLLRYMMSHEHGTPFEMCEIKLLVRVPMDCWRQWIRHRTANVNEYSTRYTEAIDSAQSTDPNEWRLQSSNNKQGSSGFLGDWSRADKALGGEFCARSTPGEYLSEVERDFQKQAREVYEQRLRFGVAREQARKDLPLSTYTEAYWKCDLRNLLGFLRLRMDGHAQQEIRSYATVIGEKIVRPLFPLSWEAFEDYQLRALKFSRHELALLAAMIHFDESSLVGDDRLSDRELQEFKTKIQSILHG